MSQAYQIEPSPLPSHNYEEECKDKFLKVVLILPLTVELVETIDIEGKVH